MCLSMPSAYHQMNFFLVFMLFLQAVSDPGLFHRSIPAACILYFFWGVYTEELDGMLALTGAIITLANYYDSVCLWFFIVVFSITEVVSSIYHFVTPSDTVLDVVFALNAITGLEDILYLRVFNVILMVTSYAVMRRFNTCWLAFLFFTLYTLYATYNKYFFWLDSVTIHTYLFKSIDLVVYLFEVTGLVIAPYVMTLLFMAANHPVLTFVVIMGTTLAYFYMTFPKH